MTLTRLSSSLPNRFLHYLISNQKQRKISSYLFYVATDMTSLHMFLDFFEKSLILKIPICLKLTNLAHPAHSIANIISHDSWNNIASTSFPAHLAEWENNISWRFINFSLLLLFFIIISSSYFTDGSKKAIKFLWRLSSREPLAMWMRSSHESKGKKYWIWLYDFFSIIIATLINFDDFGASGEREAKISKVRRVKKL